MLVPKQPHPNISNPEVTKIRKAMFKYMSESLARIQKGNEEYNESKTQHFLLHDVTAPESKVGVFFSFVENEKEWGPDEAIRIVQHTIYINYAGHTKHTNNGHDKPFEHPIRCSREQGRKLWDQCVSGFFTDYAMVMPDIKPAMIEYAQARMDNPYPDHISTEDLEKLDESISQWADRSGWGVNEVEENVYEEMMEQYRTFIQKCEEGEDYGSDYALNA